MALVTGFCLLCSFVQAESVVSLLMVSLFQARKMAVKQE